MASLKIPASAKNVIKKILTLENSKFQEILDSIKKSAIKYSWNKFLN
jgi:hypothetical protein